MKTKGMMMLASATVVFGATAITLAGCGEPNDNNRRAAFDICMASMPQPQECTDAAYRLYPRESSKTGVETVASNDAAPQSP